MNLNHALGRFRLTAIIEGISFLILLFIAMPLKYLANIPAPVKYVGWLHGLLFILYILTLLHIAIVGRWTLLKIFLAFVASLVPFGTFVLEHYMKKESDPEAGS